LKLHVPAKPDVDSPWWPMKYGHWPRALIRATQKISQLVGSINQETDIASQSINVLSTEATRLSEDIEPY